MSDAHFAPATVTRFHERTDQPSWKIRILLEERGDAKVLQIGFTNRCFGINPVNRPTDAMLTDKQAQLLIDAPSALHVGATILYQGFVDRPAQVWSALALNVAD